MQHSNESPPGALTTRRATDDDAGFLLALARAAYADVVARQFGGWRDDVHGARYLEKIRAHAFDIILLDAMPVGTVHTLDEPGRVVVNEFVVHPDFQGRGIGAWALDAVLRRARERGLPVWLHTMRENHAARAFYRRHGFVETLERDGYVELEAR